uniref:Uncharacterized protein n=1 Tax=Oryza sativa subsp. japonica TaxID=39947 RepID=Q6Z6M3_ORYSJ|nr:hypothetical protein [Oryza sativa Japonica Group]
MPVSLSGSDGSSDQLLVPTCYRHWWVLMPRRRRRRVRVAEIHPVHLSSVKGTPKLVRPPTSSSRGLPSLLAIVFLRAGHPR